MSNVINFDNRIENLQLEMVKALEMGMNHHLKRSIIYSPFRLFYKIFSSANPKMMNQVRQIIQNDITANLQSLPEFRLDIFIDDNGYLTKKGKKLLHNCKAFAVFFFRRKMSVMKAFQLVKNPRFRAERYAYVLEGVNKFTLTIIHHP